MPVETPKAIIVEKYPITKKAFKYVSSLTANKLDNTEIIIYKIYDNKYLNNKNLFCLNVFLKYLANDFFFRDICLLY